MVVMIKRGGGKLVCSGQPMTKLEVNTTDAAKEKHISAVTKDGGKTKVAVGSTLHPMLSEHYIEWIAVVAGDKVDSRFLKPGEEPKAEFMEVQSGASYAYCNLHGLWKADF